MISKGTSTGIMTSAILRRWYVITFIGMLGCGMEVAKGTPACTETTQSYELYVSISTASEITGLSIFGVPLVIPPGTVRIFGEGDFPSPLPQTLSIRHLASPTMEGAGVITYDLPRDPESQRDILSIGGNGWSWVYFNNSTDLILDRIVLETKSGEEVKPFGDGQTGVLAFPVEPGSGMYIMGLPDAPYTKVKFQAVDGMVGEFRLDAP